MATAVNVVPSKEEYPIPQEQKLNFLFCTWQEICALQRKRPNVPAETIEEWYRKNVTIPFIDHIISEVDAQFSSLAKTASKLLGLVPSVLCQTSSYDLSDTLQLYSCDLPEPQLFDQEYQQWKHFCEASDHKPSTCIAAIKHCDKSLFPNIYSLLQIACTLPVSSTECERNASTLRDYTITCVQE